MNQQKSKLFHHIFKDRYQYRMFKKAYSRSPSAKKLQILETAKKIKEKGNIHHMEVSND